MKAQIEQQKASHAAQIEALEAQLQAMSDSKDDDFRRMQLQTQTAIELTKLEVTANKDLSKQNADNQAGLSGSKAAPKASSK
jgi:cell division protein FtsL